MWNSRNKILILGKLLLLLSIITQTQAASPVYFAHYCTNTTTYTPNTTFQTNLNILLTSLSSNATKNRGFFNYTVGRDSPNIAYGLSLCRGDVTPSVCQDCVSTASKEIVTRCPTDKEAIIFYDECLLRYSDQYIFATKDGSIGFRGSNTKNISDPSQFQQILKNDMDKLASKASNIERSNENDVKGFATGSFNFSRQQTIYELVQCTPDLSVADCNQCFQEVIVQLPGTCNGAQGCRIMVPSCNIRYEVYLFYNNLVALPSPSPPSATKSKGGSSSKVIVVIIVASTCSALVILVLGFFYIVRRTKRNDDILLDESFDDEIGTAESLQYDLSTIRAATNNFSVDNKIGEGGFGSVFKGALADGQVIAVKRLSRKSGHGAEQFKNEVVLVAKLHHRNLVRLLGFCLQEEEKILIYEYIPNKSLDNFLFDPVRRQHLDWPIRYKIIDGTARGMLYLHEDSRLRIIHRDLKASNILLDGNMNPKISDFGMAKIFGVDQTHGNTNRVVGTFGYMSPEYAMHGHFSLKSDVFSYGVLVLEIICGKRNSSFYQSDGAEDLLGYAWQLWKNNRPLELMDPCLVNTFSRNEVIRCINIGLLCVQEDVMARPSMASVLMMLSSYTVSTSLPRPPPRYAYSKTELKTAERLKDESTTSSTPLSLNDLSITEVYPR